MKYLRKYLRIMLFAFFVASAAGLLSGCATDNDVSPMPWNTPQNWEGPLPSNINQGR